MFSWTSISDPNEYAKRFFQEYYNSDRFYSKETKFNNIDGLFSGMENMGLTITYTLMFIVDMEKEGYKLGTYFLNMVFITAKIFADDINFDPESISDDYHKDVAQSVVACINIHEPNWDLLEQFEQKGLIGMLNEL